MKFLPIKKVFLNSLVRITPIFEEDGHASLEPD